MKETHRKGKNTDRHAGLKVLVATAVLLAPVVVKSGLTIILKAWSKKRPR